MLVILGVCFWEQLCNFFWYLDFSLTEKLKGNGWCSQERFRGRWNDILHLKHSVCSLTHDKSRVKLVCSYWGSVWPPLRQNSEISALLSPTPTFLSITTWWQPVVLHAWQGRLPKCWTDSALSGGTETESQNVLCLPGSQDHGTLSNEKTLFTSTVG